MPTKPSKNAANRPGAIPVTIRDVGGIQHAELTLLPGVNEFRGKNGAGKTSAMNAVRRAFGDKVPLEKRDGASEGRIEIPGVVVKIRHVVKSTGEAEIEIADAGPVTRIIDPGFKGQDEAATARVRALVELLEPPFEIAAIDELAADPAIAAEVQAEFRENTFSTLSDAAERVRNTAHRYARDAENRAKVAAAQAETAEQTAAAALEKAGGRDALIDTPVAEAERIEQQAIAEAGAAAYRNRQRLALEAQQAEIRATLGKAPDPTRFDLDIELRRHAITAHEQRITDLTEQIAKERELMAGVSADHQSLKTQRRDEGGRLVRHQEAAAVLARKVEGETAVAVDALAQKAASATETRRSATVSAEVRTLLERAGLAKLERDVATTRAEDLREKATTVYDRLAELPAISERAGRLTVQAGRLHVRDEFGNLHDFELRRSEGQRIDAVLEVAAQVYGEGSVVALDDRYWLALDEEHRRTFAAAAARHGLYVITASPTAGPLTVAHLADATAPELVEVSA